MITCCVIHACIYIYIYIQYVYIYIYIYIHTHAHIYQAVTRAETSGFHAVLNQGGGDMEDDIWKMRWLILATCVWLDLEVLVVDSDIVFLSDPFFHFHLDADMEAMTYEMQESLQHDVFVTSTLK